MSAHVLAKPAQWTTIRTINDSCSTLRTLHSTVSARFPAAKSLETKRSHSAVLPLDVDLAPHVHSGTHLDLSLNRLTPCGRAVSIISISNKSRTQNNPEKQLHNKQPNETGMPRNDTPPLPAKKRPPASGHPASLRCVAGARTGPLRMQQNLAKWALRILRPSQSCFRVRSRSGLRQIAFGSAVVSLTI